MGCVTRPRQLSPWPEPRPLTGGRAAAVQFSCPSAPDARNGPLFGGGSGARAPSADRKSARDDTRRSGPIAGANNGQQLINRERGAPGPGRPGSAPFWGGGILAATPTRRGPRPARRLGCYLAVRPVCGPSPLVAASRSWLRFMAGRSMRRAGEPALNCRQARLEVVCPVAPVRAGPSAAKSGANSIH